ncbi:MAG: sigma-54-dependent Fis family transcriptional regulator [Candidatus Goldbacteria bacterium]|nr:sigma-54-dependent Fis family transcriptional regulator [Candidatus Goldiibacteriota bacterium]
MKYNILVIDDNLSSLKVIKAILEQEGYEVFITDDPIIGINLIKKMNINLCILDLKMPKINGLELYKMIREINSGIPVIIMTAYGSIESAVEAMKLGVENYLQKPLNYEELKVTISKVIEKYELKKEVELLKGHRDGKNIFENMIGSSKKMRDIFNKIINIAKTESTVLITGESGTGKEMAAKAIHNLSKRKDKKMVSINLAAIPDGLQESEMFGYEKGAFTGAVSAKKGKFEIANGGTIFLDEIGNTNYKVQAKLLRILEEKKIEPLGSNNSRDIDVRILSATNIDLKHEVQMGTFREDLYYRLNVINLHLPPLRERKADIPLLVSYFIKELSIKNDIEEKSISDAAMERLIEYRWPGNIRELRNVIEEAMVISNSNVIEADNLNLYDIDIKNASITSLNIPDEVSLYDIEKQSIINALIKSNGNQTKAAKLIGVSRKVIINKIKKYKLAKIVPIRTKMKKKAQNGQ